MTSISNCIRTHALDVSNHQCTPVSAHAYQSASVDDTVGVARADIVCRMIPRWVGMVVQVEEQYARSSYPQQQLELLVAYACRVTLCTAASRPSIRRGARSQWRRILGTPQGAALITSDSMKHVGCLELTESAFTRLSPAQALMQ